MALLKRLIPLDRILIDYIGEGSYECALPVLTLFISFGESHSRLMIDWATSSQVNQSINRFDILTFQQNLIYFKEVLQK